MKVYFCKYCGFSKKKENEDNLCPRCFHFMSEQEWEMDVPIKRKMQSIWTQEQSV